MARVLPGPYRSSPKIVCQPGLPDRDIRKYMIPRVAVRDIGVLISRVCPKLDLTRGVGAHSVGAAMNQAYSQLQNASPSSPTPPSPPQPSTYSYSPPSPPLKSSYSSSVAISNNLAAASLKSEENPSEFSPVREIGLFSAEKHSLSRVKHSHVNHSSTTQKPQNSLKTTKLKRDGFLGFPEEDSKKLKKTRFHVNTNILASSLDLLDLHKNAGMRSGSPLECGTCGITFSSVRHCKYHQSVCSSSVSNDPSRCHNVKGGGQWDINQHEVSDTSQWLPSIFFKIKPQDLPSDIQQICFELVGTGGEDGVWLCPWCPVVCLSADYLNKHKMSCRERGRCLHDGKASSQRKAVTNLSKRRNSYPASAPIKSNVLLNGSSNYKVVHGHVISH